MNTLKKTLTPSPLQHEDPRKIHPPTHQSSPPAQDQMQALEQSTISPDPKVTNEVAGLMHESARERKDKNPFSEASDLEKQREKRGWVEER